MLRVAKILTAGKPTWEENDALIYVRNFKINRDRVDVKYDPKDI